MTTLMPYGSASRAKLVAKAAGSSGGKLMPYGSPSFAGIVTKQASVETGKPPARAAGILMPYASPDHAPVVTKVLYETGKTGTRRVERLNATRR